MVEEWGRRLTSPQITELLAYFQACQDIAAESVDRALRRMPTSVDQPGRRQRREWGEDEMRAMFRAHNARVARGAA